MSTDTGYINRSEVRQIITCVDDDYVHVAEGILADVDALPITTFADKDAEIERLRAAMNDAIALLSDTDLQAEGRAGNALMCLGLTLGNQQSVRTTPCAGGKVFADDGSPCPHCGAGPADACGFQQTGEDPK